MEIKNKITSLFMVLILCLSAVPAFGTEVTNAIPPFTMAVGDTAPASDVMLSVDVLSTLRDSGYDTSAVGVTKLFSEVNGLMLNNKVTLVIYEGAAVIIVGESSPAQHVMFATDLTQILQQKGVSSRTILSSEVPSADLIDLFVQEPNCKVLVNGNVVNNVHATDRNDCYSQTSFGSRNCDVYKEYFRPGSNLLEQYYDNTDRVNSDTCIIGEEIPLCTDSDGGRNEFVKGTATGKSVFPDEGYTLKTDYCIQKSEYGIFSLDEDLRDQYLAGKVSSCTENCAVHEYYCSGETIVADVTNCPYGCSNGACLSEPEEDQEYLQDITYITGNREVYAPKEKISLMVNGIKTADRMPASSSEGWNVQYYTYDTRNPDNYLQEYVPTGNYNGNFDGRYWNANYWAPSKEGKYYTEIILYCSRENSECWNAYGGHDLEVREKIYFTVEGEAEEPVPYGEEMPEVECVDTDGGLDYYTRGKGKGLYSNSLTRGVIWGEDPNKISARWDQSLGYSIHYDVCVDTETSDQLNEAYCDASGILQSRGYNCRYGCEDGACRRGPEGEEEEVKPDIMIKNLRFVRKSRDLSTIEFDIYNQGTASLQQKFAIALYIDGRLYDHTLYDGYLGLGGVSHKTLSNYYWLSSGNIQHTITVVADRFEASQEDNPIFDEGFYDNMIDESNEYNNKVEITIGIGEGYEVPVTRGYTLADYPDMFIKYGRFNGYVVVGDKAPASDVIAAVDIVTGIQYSSATTSTTGTVVSRIEVGATKLASEIPDPKARNIISVGSSCANAVTSILKGNPNPCNKGMETGVGVIRLYEYGTHWQVVVEGNSDMDVRKAARVLANYKDYALSGTCMLVGGDFNNPKVKRCPDSYYETPITVEPVMYRSTFWINDRRKIEKMVDGRIHVFAVSDVDMYMQTGKCAVYVDGTTAWINKGDTKTINGVKIMLNDYKLEALGSTQYMRSCLITVFGKVDVDEPVPYGEEAPEEVEVVLPEVIPVDSSGQCPSGLCLVDHSCLTQGIRFVQKDTPAYCDIGGRVRAQKEDGGACQNNFECLSNSCGNGECQDFGERLEELEKEMKETKGIINRILNWLGSWFGGGSGPEEAIEEEVEEEEVPESSSPVIENDFGALTYHSTKTSTFCDFVEDTKCEVYTIEYRYNDKSARIVAGVEIHPKSFTNQHAIEGIMGEFGKEDYSVQKETYEGNNIYLFTGGHYPDQQMLAAWYSGKTVVALYVDNSPAVLTDAEVDDVFEDSLVKHYLAKYPSDLIFE